MRNIFFCILLLVIIPCNLVLADPGPYDPEMSHDHYDSSPDAIATPNDSTQLTPHIHEVLSFLLGTSLTSNEETDPYQLISANSFWKKADGSPGDSALIIALSQTTYKTIGINAYDTSTDVNIPLMTELQSFGVIGDGSNQNPFPSTLIPVNSMENFGLKIINQDFGSNDAYDSNPSNNTDSLDHFQAFHLPQLAGTTTFIGTGVDVFPYTFTEDTYLIAVETEEQSSPDYNGAFNSLLFLVTGVAPVNEPSNYLTEIGLSDSISGTRNQKLFSMDDDLFVFVKSDLLDPYASPNHLISVKLNQNTSEGKIKEKTSLSYNQGQGYVGRLPLGAFSEGTVKLNISACVDVNENGKCRINKDGDILIFNQKSNIELIEQGPTIKIIDFEEFEVGEIMSGHPDFTYFDQVEITDNILGPDFGGQRSAKYVNDDYRYLTFEFSRPGVRSLSISVGVEPTTQSPDFGTEIELFNNNLEMIGIGYNGTVPGDPQTTVVTAEANEDIHTAILAVRPMGDRLYVYVDNISYTCVPIE